MNKQRTVHVVGSAGGLGGGSDWWLTGTFNKNNRWLHKRLAWQRKTMCDNKRWDSLSWQWTMRQTPQWNSESLTLESFRSDITYWIWLPSTSQWRHDGLSGCSLTEQEVIVFFLFFFFHISSQKSLVQKVQISCWSLPCQPLHKEIKVESVASTSSPSLYFIIMIIKP